MQASPHSPYQDPPAELDAFSAAQVQGSFQQTSQMAAMGAFNGPVDYVGVKRGDKLIAACYVVYTQSRFGLEGSVWCGPLCDYDNPQVVEAMTEALRRSAKAHHAISVSCWPAAVYRLHDLTASRPATRHHDDGQHGPLRLETWRLHRGLRIRGEPLELRQGA